jgi:hypothetical protein
MAEAEGKVLPQGVKISDFRKSAPEIEPIVEPAKHFALMMGVSEDYTRLTRAVLIRS